MNLFIKKNNIPLHIDSRVKNRIKHLYYETEGVLAIAL